MKDIKQDPNKWKELLCCLNDQYHKDFTYQYLICQLSGAGEMTQWGRALAALSEDGSLIPSTNMEQLTTPITLAPEDLMPLY